MQEETAARAWSCARTDGVLAECTAWSAAIKRREKRYYRGLSRGRRRRKRGTASTGCVIGGQEAWAVVGHGSVESIADDSRGLQLLGRRMGPARLWQTGADNRRLQQTARSRLVRCVSPPFCSPLKPSAPPSLRRLTSLRSVPPALSSYLHPVFLPRFAHPPPCPLLGHPLAR